MSEQISARPYEGLDDRVLDALWEGLVAKAGEYSHQVATSVENVPMHAGASGRERGRGVFGARRDQIENYLRQLFEVLDVIEVVEEEQKLRRLSEDALTQRVLAEEALS